MDVRSSYSNYLEGDGKIEIQLTEFRVQALQAIGFEMEKGITKRSLRSCTGSEPMLHVPEGRMREIRFTTRGVSLTIHDNVDGDEVLQDIKS